MMQSLIRVSQQQLFLCGKCLNGNIVSASARNSRKMILDSQRIDSNCRYSSIGDIGEIRVGIIGAPMAKGQRKQGVDNGPNAMRDAGLVTTLNNMGVIVTDYGNVEFDDYANDEPQEKMRNPIYVFNALRKISERVSAILRENGQICLTLGGDHSIGTSTVHGHSQVYKDKLCLLWVDAHADINTTLTTNSGNIHGMSVSFLLHELKHYRPSVPQLNWLKPCLSANSIAYIGLRDVEPSEMIILHNLGIKYFTMREIDKYGIQSVVEQAMDSINPRGDKYMHVSFDIDSVDKLLAPSTGTPVPGGLTRREALTLAEEISSSGLLVGLDLVEVNPSLGTAEDAKKTVMIAVDIIASFFGRQRTGISMPSFSSLPKP